MVEVGEGGGEVAAGVRGYSAFLARVRVLQLLATFELQRLDPGVVSVGSLDIAHGEVCRCSVVQRTRFPDQVACAGQQVDGGLGVPQSLGVAAQDKKAPTLRIRIRPAGTPRLLCSSQGVQDRQAALRLPGQNQGHAQAGRDIGLPIQVSGLAREPARGLELLDRLTGYRRSL